MTTSTSQRSHHFDISFPKNVFATNVSFARRQGSIEGNMFPQQCSLVCEAFKTQKKNVKRHAISNLTDTFVFLEISLQMSFFEKPAFGPADK